MINRPSSAYKQTESIKPHQKIISDMEERLNLNCYICSHTFNTSNRIPKIVCRRQHTYCSECVGLLQRARPLRCPQCRFKIYEENVFINRALVSVCQYLPNLKQQIDDKCGENQKLKQQNRQLKEQLQKLKLKMNVDIDSFSNVIEDKKNKEQKKSYTVEKDRVLAVSRQIQRAKLKTSNKQKLNPQNSFMWKAATQKKKETKTNQVRSKNQSLFSFSPIIRNYRPLNQ